MKECRSRRMKNEAGGVEVEWWRVETPSVGGDVKTDRVTWATLELSGSTR